jgi:hypothetical protein
VGPLRTDILLVIVTIGVAGFIAEAHSVRIVRPRTAPQLPPRPGSGAPPGPGGVVCER